MPAVLADAQRRSKEDAVADEAAPEDRRRKRPDVLPGFRHRSGPPDRRQPAKPRSGCAPCPWPWRRGGGGCCCSARRNSQGTKRKVPSACLDNRRPREKGVADRVPYRADTEVINGVLVREELEHFPDSPLVFLRMVQPADKRSHAMPPWELSGSPKRPCLLKIPAWPGRCGMSGHITRYLSATSAIDRRLAAIRAAPRR